MIRKKKLVQLTESIKQDMPLLTKRLLAARDAMYSLPSFNHSDAKISAKEAKLLDEFPSSESISQLMRIASQVRNGLDYMRRKEISTEKAPKPPKSGGGR